MTKNSDILQNLWTLTPGLMGEVVFNRFYKRFDWIKYLDRRLIDKIQEGNARVIVNVPPRHGKSLYISVLLPLWYLEHYPDRHVIITSYGANLSQRWGRMIRDVLQDESKGLSTQLDPSSRSVKEFHTTEGGRVLCSSTGGAVTGSGGHLVIVDDPIKGWAEAHSPTVTEACYEWFRNTLRTRVEPGGNLVILMTRWSSEDLTGKLLQDFPGEWDTINLPAFALEEDPLERPYGQPLCPERWGVTALNALKNELSEPAFLAEFQQIPRKGLFGAAYTGFTEDLVRPQTYNPSEPLHISFDFNISPGMNAVLGQSYGGKSRALADFHGEGWDIPRIIDNIALYAASGSLRADTIYIYGDTSGNARSHQTSKTSYDQVRFYLREHFGNNIKIFTAVPKKAPPLVGSIDVFNTVMSRGLYEIDPRCKVLLRDLRELKRDPNGGIIKSSINLSHASDAERYRIYQLKFTMFHEDRKKASGRVLTVSPPH